MTWGWVRASGGLCAPLLCASLALAVVTVKDGFESYEVGPLDKNDFGPNEAPNGYGNPWFGPIPPNGQVVPDSNDILPRTGNRMLRGAFIDGTDFDQNWYNIQYRHNCGQPLRGNLELDWWFHDPDGPGGVNFRDYAALAFYSLAPSDTDYPGEGSLNNSAQIQRLSLGATTAAGLDPHVYQARIVGASDGATAAGWFNLPVARSVGWHHARISVGPPLADHTNNVRFYIDDMATPALEHNSVLAYGYNIIELNTKFGTHTGYFDDLTFTATDDADSDGVLDTCDRCQGTLPGTPVDAFGCTRIPGDFNRDGRVDADDLTIFINCLPDPPPAPAVPYDLDSLPSICPLTPDFDGFLPADFNQNGLLDMDDFGILQRCYRASAPADPDCAD